MSPEHCSDFYADQYGTPHFPRLTAFMSSGPVIAMVLAQDDAISHWKHLIGPGNSVLAKKTHPDRQIFIYLHIFATYESHSIYNYTSVDVIILIICCPYYCFLYPA